MFLSRRNSQHQKGPIFAVAGVFTNHQATGEQSTGGRSLEYGRNHGYVVSSTPIRATDIDAGDQGTANDVSGRNPRSDRPDQASQDSPGGRTHDQLVIDNSVGRWESAGAKASQDGTDLRDVKME